MNPADQAMNYGSNSKLGTTLPQLIALIFSFAVVSQAFVTRAFSQSTISKADNQDDLNLTTSWAGGVVPGVNDTALWDANVTSANSASLGSNLSWGGISLTNPGGAVTITGANTLSLGNGGINMSSAAADLAISSNLTISGGQTWNIAAGRVLTLSTGIFSRSPGSALNIQGPGTVSASMTGLANTNGIIGPWATVGTGTGTRFATLSGGNIVGFTGGTAVAAFGWPSGNNNTFNYDVAAIQGNLGVGRQANTVRYTGAAGTQNWGNNNTTTVTLNGLMNAGTGTLTFGEAGGTSQGQLAIGTNNGNQLVLSAAAADIQINIPIINTGANAGSLLITGPGTVNVTSSGGVSTFTGATSIASGTLAVTGVGNINSTSSINVDGQNARYLHTSSVASTRTLSLTRGTVDGTGSIGSVTIADNAANVITNGNGGTGALTLASLTFGGDATANLNLGLGVGLNVTGTLSTNPASGTVTVNATKSGWTLGSNNLIGFGTFSGSANDFTLGTVTGLGARQVASGLAVSGNFITLNVGGDLPVWTGLNGSAWTTASTGDNAGPNNWATKVAQGGTNFWVTDNPEFNDSYNLGAGDVAVTNRAVDIQGANVAPGVVTFNNSTGNYTLGSSTGHGISGSASLVKSGTSALIITNVNSFTGATTINGGTLQIGDGTTNGSIATSSGITNNGSLVYNLTSAQSYGNVISGTGSVTKQGGGTLTLSGNNSYQGGTVISGGALTINGAGTLGTGGVSINGGATLNINRDYVTSVAVTGSGNINNTGSHTVTGDFSGFSGTYTHNSSAVSSVFNTAVSTSENAAYAIASAQGSSQGMIAAGAGNYTLKMGSLSGVAGSLFRGGNAAAGVVTLEVGNLNTNTTFAGSINNGAAKNISLTKVGTGDLTLSGVNGYTGATTVNSGRLLVNGSTAAGSAVTVNGGTLGGTGSIAGAINVNSGATLAPGNSIESLRTGTLNFNAGSVFAYELDTNSLNGDLLFSTGDLNISAGAVLTLDELFAGLVNLGNKLTLIGYTGAWNNGTFTYMGNTLADDSIFTLGSNSWLLNYNDTVGGNNFAADQLGASGFLTITAVPEPSSLLLGGLAILGLAAFRRRSVS